MHTTPMHTITAPAPWPPQRRIPCWLARDEAGHTSLACIAGPVGKAVLLRVEDDSGVMVGDEGDDEDATELVRRLQAMGYRSVNANHSEGLT